MSRAFRAKGRSIITVKVPARNGGWINRSTKTRDRATANHYQQMIEELGPRGTNARDVLDTLTDGRCDVPSLYEHWISSGRNLTQLRKMIEDVDVSAALVDWEAELISRSSGISDDTAAHYIRHVRAAIPRDTVWRASDFNAENIQRILNGMRGAAPATVRKAGAAFARAAKFLRQHGVITSDVMRDVSLPRAGRPRTNFLDTRDAARLADAQPEPFRTFSALLAGTGVEVSVALNLRRRDVDIATREIRAAGTKTHSRDRYVRVAEWAWDYLEPQLAGLLPDARIFASIPTRWSAGDMHRRAIVRLEKEFSIYAGYTMRDARHTYAVRAIKAGTPAEYVARQLGHVDGVLVMRVYGRFVPQQSERARWEMIAAARDAEVNHHALQEA